MPGSFFVIGSPVAHSLSPQIHSTLFERYGLSGFSYGIREVTKAGLPAFLDEVRKTGVSGFNITMPLKQDVLPYLDFIDQSAQKGANTVVQKDGKLLGYSTDAPGFFRALRTKISDLSGKTILFIGAGAVAEALAGYASSQGMGRIFIVNRTATKAQKIATQKNMLAGGLDALLGWLPECDILVNTTPLGMAGTNEDFDDLSFLEQLKKGALVCDLIYKPDKTAFLKSAQALGFDIQNGLYMLIWQAFFAFEKFTGILPTDADFEYILSLLQKN
ncbi:MAG: shikimate dehydrogenase family protein [Christensenellaceae bacterium]|jgi:shikimate dehydrogenase